MISTLHLLRYANLLQISIRDRPQRDPCDLVFWVTVIRNLTGQIKNSPISAFIDWRPTSKRLLPLSETFAGQIPTRFVDSPFGDVLLPADH